MRAPESPLELSQKKLYLAVKKELALYEKKKKKELVAYERAFRSALPRTVRASGKPQLLRAISRANVVLVGDFHPFRQSQKGFLRLVEGARERFPRVAVALECFQQAHQTAINEFLSGLITAEELRDKIDFERYWPFSWENYREIITFARQNRLSVLALNIVGRKGKDSELSVRDAAAAERIVRELKEHPGTAVFALYGELHLGRRHLPAELGKRLGHASRIVTVHQNDAELYWKAPTLGNGQKPEVLRLGPGEFCILNSVPWVKLRSYLDWLEGSPSPDVDEEELDVVGIVHHYARLLGEAAGLAVAVDDSVEIIPPDRLAGRGLPARLRGLRPPDRDLALHALAFHRTGYLPRRSTLILPTVSTNSMAEAAAHLLRHSLRSSARGGARWSTYDWISHFLLGYLGSKILNPKRKCNEVSDLKRLAKAGTATSARSEIAGRALTLLRPYLRDARSGARRPRLRRRVRELEACRTAGFVLGERFFLALLAHPNLLERLRDMMRRGAGRVVLKEAAAGIARRREPGTSKRDRF